VFALSELSVKSVVICGHSGCAAMSALIAEAKIAPEYAPGTAAHAAAGAGRGPVDAWLAACNRDCDPASCT
jgi:carbonic anhydrase